MATLAAIADDSCKAASSGVEKCRICGSSSVTEDASASWASVQSAVWAPEWPRLARLQLCYIKEVPATTSGVANGGSVAECSEVFERCIRPYVLRQLSMARQSCLADDMDTCQSSSASEATTAGDEPIVLMHVGAPGSVLMIDGARFLVECFEYRDFLNAERRSLGVVTHEENIADEDTLLFIRQEVSATFSSISILPYSDTLPTTYDFDIFEDYLLPFFSSQPLEEFARRDSFTYQGVRFRVTHVQPADAVGRVGLTTEIHCDGQPLQPKLRDMLGPELRRRLSVFPGFMHSVVGHLLLQTTLRPHVPPGEGLDAFAIGQCEIIRWSAEYEAPTASCRVCLSAFADNETLRRLACGHVFHVECVDAWLARSPYCPLCKQHALSCAAEV